MKIQSARELGSKVFFCLKKKNYDLLPYDTSWKVFAQWGIRMELRSRHRPDMIISTSQRFSTFKFVPLTNLENYLSLYFVDFCWICSFSSRCQNRAFPRTLRQAQYPTIFKEARKGWHLYGNGGDWYWLQRLTSCERVGADHDLDPLTKDKLNFTLHGSLTWEI